MDRGVNALRELTGTVVLELMLRFGAFHSHETIET